MSNSEPSVQWNPDLGTIAETLSPIAMALEQERQNYLAKKRRATMQCLVVVGVTLLAVLGLLVGEADPPWVIGAIALGVIISVIFYSVTTGKFHEIYRQRYKHEYFARVTQMIAPGMVYQPNHFIPEAYFTGTGLHKSRIDRYSGQDHFSGKVGSTTMTFSEIHAERRETTRDSKGHTRTRWVTVFRGIFLIADFHKHFQGQVLIETDFAESAFGWLGRKMQNLSGNLVRLENPEFEKAFKVRGTDPVETRYLLTPTMQESLLEMRRFWGNDIAFSLQQNHLFITIPKNTDWFECNSKIEATNASQLHDFASQLISVLNVVNVLQLNTRLWTRE